MLHRGNDVLANLLQTFLQCEGALGLVKFNIVSENFQSYSIVLQCIIIFHKPDKCAQAVQ